MGTCINRSSETSLLPWDCVTPRTHLVMERYQLGERLAQSSYSTIYSATDMDTGQFVAVKVYKLTGKGGLKLARQVSQRFRREVHVLQALQQSVEPTRRFLELLHFSQQRQRPGPDARDGLCCVICELGEQSLQQLAVARREQEAPLSRLEVQDLAQTMLITIAALHARGFVHLDIRLGNFVYFTGTLKLIDFDSCLPLGPPFSARDDTLDYEPSRMAPEFARAYLDRTSLPATPRLDLWSTGLALCELAVGEQPCREAWGLQGGREVVEGAADLEAFFQWLAKCEDVHLQELTTFDPALQEFVKLCMLQPSKSNRASLRDCLKHPYLTGR